MVLELKIEVQMLINNKLKSERALGRIAPVPANYFLTFALIPWDWFQNYPQANGD